MRPKTFWFHYNKPASKKQGRNVLTVHWNGQCHLVNSLNCNVPVETSNRKQQPRCVIKGKATDIAFGQSGSIIHASIY